MTGSGQDPDDAGMLDADDFLTFTSQLRTLHAEVDGAQVTDRQRARWQRRLLRITETARDDLARAGDQLGRLRSEVERILGR